jgi:hypothetical protein
MKRVKLFVVPWPWWLTETRPEWRTVYIKYCCLTNSCVRIDSAEILAVLLLLTAYIAFRPAYWLKVFYVHTGVWVKLYPVCVHYFDYDLACSMVTNRLKYLQISWWAFILQFILIKLCMFCVKQCFHSVWKDKRCSCIVDKKAPGVNILGCAYASRLIYI